MLSHVDGIAVVSALLPSCYSETHGSLLVLCLLLQSLPPFHPTVLVVCVQCDACAIAFTLTLKLPGMLPVPAHGCVPCTLLGHIT